MQLAVIAPSSLAWRFCSKQKIHLCLSYLINSDPTYRRFYQERVKLGDHVILDNSAYERGSSDSIDDLLQALVHLEEPAEIVLPDILRDAEATLDVAMKAILRLEDEGIRFTKTKIMAVPQGKNPEEWKQCLDAMLAGLPDFHTIGIPVLCEEWIGGRYGLAQHIPEQMEFHLLGWGRYKPTEPALIASGFPNARSIDTAKPLHYALHSIDLNDFPNLAHAPECPNRKEGFFELEASPWMTVYGDRNIQVYRDCIGDHHVDVS
jgi:hypothetical protein